MVPASPRCTFHRSSEAKKWLCTNTPASFCADSALITTSDMDRRVRLCHPATPHFTRTGIDTLVYREACVKVVRLALLPRPSSSWSLPENRRRSRDRGRLPWRARTVIEGADNRARRINWQTLVPVKATLARQYGLHGKSSTQSCSYHHWGKKGYACATDDNALRRPKVQ